LHRLDSWAPVKPIIIYGPRVADRFTQKKLHAELICIPHTFMSRYALICFAQVFGYEVLIPASSSSRLLLILRLMRIKHVLIADKLLNNNSSGMIGVLTYHDVLFKSLINKNEENSKLLSSWHIEYMQSYERIDKILSLCMDQQINKIVFEGKGNGKGCEEALDRTTLIVLHPDIRKRGSLESMGLLRGCTFIMGGLTPSEWAIVMNKVDNSSHLTIYAYEGLLMDLIRLRSN
jgi:hypothetical protein